MKMEMRENGSFKFLCLAVILFTVVLILPMNFAHAQSDLKISTTTLARGTVDEPYSFKLKAEGGKAPYTFSISNKGTLLPKGLSINSEGVISGTPEVSGAYYNVYFKVTDSEGNVSEKKITIRINPYLVDFTATDLMQFYDGTPKSATIKVKDNKYPLKQFEDYEVFYGVKIATKNEQGPKNVGSYMIRIRMTNPKYVFNSINNATFTVMQRPEGKIRIGYGNSPVAKIRGKFSSSDQSKADEFINVFKESFSFKNFLDENVPSGADKETVYSEEAWRGIAEGNQDLNENTVFLSDFRSLDTKSQGYVMNVEGQYADGLKVEKNVFKYIIKGLKLRDAGKADSVFDAGNDYDLNSVAFKDLMENKKTLVKEGIYRLEYSFTDRGQFAEPKEIKGFRYVVISDNSGDLNKDRNVNALDRLILETVIKNPGNFESLWVYRCCDLNRDGKISEEDLHTFDKRFSGKIKKFYR